jgi:hypothetical protein
MKQWLAPAHLVMTLAIIIWNVVLAGRIAQVRHATRPFAAVTALAGLMLLPAFIVAIATTTLITGRGIAAIDWVWPATIVLFTVQSVYAIARRLVNPLVGYPIAFYNALLAIATVSRFMAAHGVDLPRPLLVIMAAQVDALALVTTDAAIVSPFFLHVPLVSPAFPAISRLTAGFRIAAGTIALAWLGIIMAEIPRADQALDSYDSHADDRLTERPTGFAVGLKIFPDIERPPSTAAVRADIETLAWTRVNALNVVFVPGASALAIDSVARTIDRLPRDSMVIIATIGYGGKLLPELGRVPLDPELRLRTIDRVMRQVRPDIILPAQDPYGLGARILGRLPVERWQDYHVRASALVKRLRPRTRVGLSASAFDARDSTLYAWAAAPGSPIDVLGFSFYPTRLGARSMDAGLRAVDRWLRVHPPEKPHWVFGAGGYPLAHGEVSQERAVWAALSWATAHLPVRGLVVTEANDYGQSMGVRAPTGRYRDAAASLRRAVGSLRETFRERAAFVPATP